MRSTTLPALAALALLLAAPLGAEPEYPKMGPDIYDARADGGTLVGDALRRASAEHKRVIVDLGANWYLSIGN